MTLDPPHRRSLQCQDAKIETIGQTLTAGFPVSLHDYQADTDITSCMQRTSFDQAEPGRRLSEPAKNGSNRALYLVRGSE